MCLHNGQKVGVAGEDTVLLSGELSSYNVMELCEFCPKPVSGKLGTGLDGAEAVAIARAAIATTVT
jgi:hypothetical protein